MHALPPSTEPALRQCRATWGLVTREVAPSAEDRHFPLANPFFILLSFSSRPSCPSFPPLNPLAQPSLTMWGLSRNPTQTAFLLLTLLLTLLLQPCTAQAAASVPTPPSYDKSREYFPDVEEEDPPEFDEPSLANGIPSFTKDDTLVPPHLTSKLSAFLAPYVAKYDSDLNPKQKAFAAVFTGFVLSRLVVKRAMTLAKYSFLCVVILEGLEYLPLKSKALTDPRSIHWEHATPISANLRREAFKVAKNLGLTVRKAGPAMKNFGGRLWRGRKLEVLYVLVGASFALFF